MTLLAHEIYRQLLQLLRARKTSITYAALAARVSRRIPTHQRSRGFHAALGEVSRACRAAKLPCLPAMVWRSGSRRPAAGYFAIAHPRSRSDKTRRAAWEREHANLVREAPRFPVSL
jgi:hypothetical protein